MKNAGEITVTREVNGETETRKMSQLQWANIGDNPVSNGGWKVAKPSEAKKATENSELENARARYEELTGEKAGNRKLETLLEGIKAAEEKAAGENK